jgi:hypothetical protein
MAGISAGHFVSSRRSLRAQRPTSWKSSWLGALTVLLRMSPPGTCADA